MASNAGISQDDVQRTQLLNALVRKHQALEAANKCLSGDTQQEINQRSDNEQEIGLLRQAIVRIGAGGTFNYPGDSAIDALEAAAAALFAASLSCGDKGDVEARSSALIALVPASSV